VLLLTALLALERGKQFWKSFATITSFDPQKKLKDGMASAIISTLMRRKLANLIDKL
jgi:hypothetical protein